MYREKAKVISRGPDTLTIQFQRKIQCGCCRLGNLCAPKDEVCTLANSSEVRALEGDMVEVGIEEKKPIVISVLLFLIPTVILLSTLVLFRQYGEFRSFFLSIVNIAVYFIVLKVILKKKPLECSLKVLRKV